MKWSFVIVPLGALALVTCWALFSANAVEPEGADDSAAVVIRLFYRSRTFNDRDDDPIAQKQSEIRINVPLQPGDMAEKVERVELPADDPQFVVEATALAEMLQVEILNARTKRPIASSTFPIDKSTAKHRDSIHGFSGLSYVKHPDNDAELQFWCQLPQAKPRRLLEGFRDLFGGGSSREE